VLTFGQFVNDRSVTINETDRPEYSEWGVIAPSGKIIPGDSHKTASSHHDLGLAHHKNKATYNAYDYARYAREPASGRLNLMTYNHKSLKGAAKSFDKLPHTASKSVYHDHYDDDGNSDARQGHKDAVYNHIKHLLNK
jgi:hypothetical protein